MTPESPPHPTTTTTTTTALSKYKTLLPTLWDKDYNKNREEMSKVIYEVANKTVFGEALPPLPELTIQWSKTLLTTAGRFNYKRTSKSNQHYYSEMFIELSTKVLDSLYVFLQL